VQIKLSKITSADAHPDDDGLGQQAEQKAQQDQLVIHLDVGGDGLVGLVTAHGIVNDPLRGCGMGRDPFPVSERGRDPGRRKSPGPPYA